MLFKIAAAARLLWRPVYATRDLHRMNKMFLQMRDMFQEQGLVSQHDVIEQHQVLVQLSHVTHMRHLTEHAHWKGLCHFLLTKDSKYRKNITSEIGFPSGKDGKAAKERFALLLAGLDAEPEILAMLCELRTLPQQALLYRMCGDRNPLHSDLAVARSAGRPSAGAGCRWDTRRSAGIAGG